MPKWLDNAIFYEIYPQTFRDSNADGIGDFQGILEKLDYVRDLGCNAIWLNPCFASPFGDAGYDVADYYRAAPRYGTNEDLKRLFEEAHRRGIRVLLDLVPGHTSWEHPWFKASMEAERNEFTDRYVWTDDIWERPEGMDCLRGISQRNGACAVNFFSNQPALNYGYYQVEKSWQQSVDAPGPRATLEAMKDVMRFWLRMGCDGFRVDMAMSLVKNDPESKGTIALWQEVMDFLGREFPDAAMISEWGEPDKSLAGGFHMDFLLHGGPSHYDDLFRCAEPFFSSRGRGDASKFAGQYQRYVEKTGGKGLICIPSGNHDTARLAPLLGEEELKIAFAFLLTMPGAPFLYYGDEIGMRYVEGLTSVEGGFHRTGARTPMQWDDSVNAGFSAAPADRLYIPVDPSPDRPTVQAQMADPNSLYHEIKRLISIRQAHEALQSNASVSFVYARENAYPLAYVRRSGSEEMLVILNPSASDASFPMTFAPWEPIYCFGGSAKFSPGLVSVPASSAGIYRL
jgi:maltose alpha-D-glucosyltransferase/alpha-amylase